MQSLQDKELIMLVSPSAMGKSTIMNHAVRLDAEFTRVRSFTTRPARANDEPNQYFYISAQDLVRARKRSAIVTETTFAGNGHTYGEFSESYASNYCLLDTSAEGVASHQELPLKASMTISIITSPQQWQEQFRARYPTPTDETRRRLDQAKQSLLWSLAQPDHTWLINDAAPDVIASHLIAIVRGTRPGDDGAGLARQCLDSIGTMYLGDA